MNRNVILLCICQIFYMSVVVIMMTNLPLIGKSLGGGTDAIATLPIGILNISIFLTAYLASIMMSRVGRRNGLMIGAIVGLSGACIVVFSLVSENFFLFCLGSMGLGSFFACAQYYRFAAAELADNSKSSLAISYVLAGGVIAAIIAPMLTKMTRDSLPIDFAGNYLVVIVLCVVSIFVLSNLDVVEKAPNDNLASKTAKLDSSSLLFNPWFLVAVIGALVSYGVMALLMAATPLAMQANNHSFNQTANVMQWHFLGMFAPAFFTGHLIKKFGVLSMMLAGGLVMILSSIAGIAGSAMGHFVLSLLLLGVGWNFLFISASTFLADTFTDKKLKAKAQGLNETLVSATMIVTAILSGVIHEYYGWKFINIISILIVMASLVSILVAYSVGKKRVISDMAT